MNSGYFVSAASQLFPQGFLPLLETLLAYDFADITGLTFFACCVAVEGAVAAVLGEVWVFGREDDFLLARIETEDLGFVLALGVGAVGGGATARYGFGRVGGLRLGLGYLDDGTAAIPVIWRKKFVPKRICGREGNAVEEAVAFAHALVARGVVAQVEAVAVFDKILPRGGRLGGGDGEVILGLEVRAVVGFIYGLNVV